MKLQYEDNLMKQKESAAKEKENHIHAIITLSANLEISLGKEDIFLIQLKGNINNIKKILAEVEKNENPSDKTRIFKTITSSIIGLKFTDVVDAKENSIWTKDEIFDLQKAVKKFSVDQRHIK